MADIFKRTTLNYGGGFAADRGLVTPNKGFNGIMLTNIGINYAQRIMTIYDIGNAGQVPNVYKIGGRSAGQATAAHVLGPAQSMKDFYQNFSDVCQAGDNDLVFDIQSSACPPNNAQGPARPGGFKMKALYVTLANVSFNVSVENMLIQESSTLDFSNLEYDD